LLHFLNDKGKKQKNLYSFFEGKKKFHILFVTFVLIFKFIIIIYLLHVLFVLKIEYIFEKKNQTQKCLKG